MRLELDFKDAIIRTASNGEQFYEIKEEINIGTGKGLLHLVVPKRYADEESDVCKKFIFEYSDCNKEWSIWS